MYQKRNNSQSPKRNPNKAIGLGLLVLFVIVATNSISYGQAFVTKWGTDTTSDGRFNIPIGVAVDSSTNVYVTDSFNSRIQKFDSSGNFILKWGSPGSGDNQFLGTPRRIAVDSGGNVYVTESLPSNQIKKFDSSGNFLTKWGSSGIGNGQFWYLEGIAVDSGGNVYAVDSGNNRIQKFIPSGSPPSYTYDKQWGSAGTGDGQFNSPRGLLSIPQDMSMWLIPVMPASRYLTPPGLLLGSGVPQDLEITSLMDLRQSSSIHRAMLMWLINTIIEFRSLLPPEARPLRTRTILRWVAACTGNGQFNQPTGIAVDSSGNSYIADALNLRIQKFNSALAYLSQWGSDAYGNGHLNYPHHLATDSAGYIYVADTENFRIQKFNSSGVYQAQFGSYGSGNGQFNFPVGVAVDAGGNIYVTDGWTSRVQQFNSSGIWQATLGSPGDLNFPMGIAVDSGGKIYVADFYNDAIKVYSGSTWTMFGTSFNRPRGIAIDSSGSVYVTDSGNNQIQKFDSSGTFIKSWGSSGTGDGQFYTPDGIAVDSVDHVYVVDSQGARIQKFDSNGNFITKWGSSGNGDGQFLQPIGITTDSSGNIYVSEGVSDRIQKFSVITAPVLYVDAGVSASGVGTSWSTAYKTIQEAVLAAIANTEIWVKQGTYTLTGATPPTVNEILVNKVVGIYGGFNGTGTCTEPKRLESKYYNIAGPRFKP